MGEGKETKQIFDSQEIPQGNLGERKQTLPQ